MQNAKPNILFVCPLPPPVHGSSMVSNYIKESTLINEEFCLDFVNLSTSRKMSEIGKFSIVKILRFLASYLLLLWKLTTHRYDLVYMATTVHGTGFLKDFPYMLMARLFCRHRVIHQHNKGMANYVDKSLYRCLLKWAYKDANVMLLSDRLYEDIRSIVSSDKIMICPNGLPPIDDKNVIEKKYTDKPSLLYLSNLITSKGIFILLDACKVLKERGYRFSCNFVGGETKEVTRDIFENEISQRDIQDFVHYIGPKYGNEKEKYWDCADIFVFPTYYYNECFPLVILEAMQHSVPIVSSNEGGIADIIQDGLNGYIINTDALIDKKSAGTALADKLEVLLKDASLREQMGRRSRELYEEKFTLQKFEERFVECIKQCL